MPCRSIDCPVLLLVWFLVWFWGFCVVLWFWFFFLPREQGAKRQMVILIILGVMDPEIFLHWQNLGDKSGWKNQSFCFVSCFSSDYYLLFCLFLTDFIRPATKPWRPYCSFCPNKFFWDRLSFRAVGSRSDRPWCLGENKHCAVIPSVSIEGLAQQQTWLLSAYNVL